MDLSTTCDAGATNARDIVQLTEPFIALPMALMDAQTTAEDHC